MSGSRCRSDSCQAPIVWALSPATGKAIPLDVLPNPGGNITVIEDGRKLTVKVWATSTLAAENEPDPERRFISHFATCPDAPAWRRR